MPPSAEAAEQLGTNDKLLERLVEWCEAKDHAGVMGESNRLLSALIRHSKSKVGPGLAWLAWPGLAWPGLVWPSLMAKVTPALISI